MDASGKSSLRTSAAENRAMLAGAWCVDLASHTFAVQSRSSRPALPKPVSLPVFRIVPMPGSSLQGIVAFVEPALAGNPCHTNANQYTPGRSVCCAHAVVSPATPMPAGTQRLVSLDALISDHQSNTKLYLPRRPRFTGLESRACKSAKTRSADYVAGLAEIGVVE